ncbi:unnamed protein product [Prunus armeniaca]
MRSPNEDHMAGVMHILSYLKPVPERGNITDRRFASGYFTFVGGNLVPWCSKNQNAMSQSSAKFEYREIAQGIGCCYKAPLNPVQHDPTKCVEVDWHFIKEKLEHKLISIAFVPSSKQLANMLTHVVSKCRFESSLDKLGSTDFYAPN